MQKFIYRTLSVCVAVIFLLCASVNAADYEGVTSDSLLSSEDYSEIQGLEKTILEDAYQAFVTEYQQEPVSMPKTLDYANAVKIYVDADLLGLQTDRQSELMTAMEESGHIWILDIPVDNCILSVTLGKGLPLNEDRAEALTEEEQEQIRQNEGKWKVNAVGVTTPEEAPVQSYTDQINNSLANNATELSDVQDVVIVGGVAPFQYPIALAMDGEKAIAWISLGQDFVTSSLEGDTFSEEKASGVYDFNELAEYARTTYSNKDEELSGGSSDTSKIDFKLMGFCGIAALVILIISFVVYRKRSKH